LFDLRTMSRRRMLAAIGGAGALTAAGARLLASSTPAAAASCAAEVESETAGPYPADGSNGPQVRTLAGIVRSDIRSSLGTATGVGAAVYAWHCDAQGRYSLYSTGVTNQNYLRGVQPTDTSGTHGLR
jgi:protocatechuate 3,4-dioxygenase beta subunit